MKKHKIKVWKEMIFAYLMVAVLIGIIIGGELWKKPVSLLSPVSTAYAYDGIPTPTMGWTGLRHEIEKYIRTKFGKDGELAIKVAKCESGLKPDAYNLNEGKSLDRGIFMINAKYHPEVTSECAFNARCNIDATYRMYVAQGYSFMPAWKWSKPCWEK